MTGQTVAWTPMWWARPANGDSSGNKLFPINARSETVTDKPIFSDSFRHRRCLVPADGFYEWKRTKDNKIPYYFFRNDKKTIFIAAIYDEGQFCMITEEASQNILEIHHRQPVILYEKDICLLYTSPSPRDLVISRMPSSA